MKSLSFIRPGENMRGVDHWPVPGLAPDDPVPTRGPQGPGTHAHGPTTLFPSCKIGLG